MSTELPTNLEPIVVDACRTASDAHGWEISEDGLVSGARELFRLLCCKAKSPTLQLSFPPRLDSAWHQLILNTEDYASVCASIGKTIHHSTKTTFDLAKCERLIKLYKEAYPEASHTCEWWEFDRDEKRAVKRERDEAESDVYSIFLKSPHGNSMPVVVSPETRVETLKRTWQKVKGIEPCFQRMVFAGRELTDWQTLGDENIKSESTIYVISGIRGC
jgi:hypothetical protein